MINPRLHDQRPNAVHHHHRIPILRGNRQDQVVTAMPRRQVLAVALIAVNGDVALAGIAVDKHHRHLALDGHIPCAGGIEVVQMPI